MIKITSARDKSRIRRIALSAQGLIQSQPFGRGLQGARNAINHIGYVQIDTISVVERAHNHVLYARVPNFSPDMIHKLLFKGDIFEYWSHAAAFIPMQDYRFSLPYKHAIKNGKVHWFRNKDKKLMSEILAQVRSDGPIRSRDLESSASKRSGWWDWKPAKKAIEQLYMEGELMVKNRDGFQKTYDLPERVLPNDIDTSMPTTTEFAEHLIDQQLRCHGLVSLKGLTYLRRDSELRQAVKQSVEQRLAGGELEKVELKTGDVYFIEAGGLSRRLP